MLLLQLQNQLHLCQSKAGFPEKLPHLFSPIWPLIPPAFWPHLEDPVVIGPWDYAFPQSPVGVASFNCLYCEWVSCGGGTSYLFKEVKTVPGDSRKIPRGQVYLCYCQRFNYQAHRVHTSSHCCICRHKELWIFSVRCRCRIPDIHFTLSPICVSSFWPLAWFSWLDRHIHSGVSVPSHVAGWKLVSWWWTAFRGNLRRLVTCFLMPLWGTSLAHIATLSNAELILVYWETYRSRISVMEAKIRV